MHEREHKKTALFITELEKIVNKTVIFFYYFFPLIYQN